MRRAYPSLVPRLLLPEKNTSQWGTFTRFSRESHLGYDLRGHGGGVNGIRAILYRLGAIQYSLRLAFVCGSATFNFAGIISDDFDVRANGYCLLFNGF